MIKKKLFCVFLNVFCLSPQSLCDCIMSADSERLCVASWIDTACVKSELNHNAQKFNWRCLVAHTYMFEPESGEPANKCVDTDYTYFKNTLK